jgi:hypothetical protein
MNIFRASLVVAAVLTSWAAIAQQGPVRAREAQAQAGK